MMRIITFVLLSLILPSAALAVCICTVFKGAKSHIDATDVIFEGTVVDIQGIPIEPNKPLRTQFRVTRAWKGGVSGKVHVQHPAPIVCGWVLFAFGESYKVFATRYDDGSLHTNNCLQPRFDEFEARAWSEYEAILNGKNTD